MNKDKELELHGTPKALYDRVRAGLEGLSGRAKSGHLWTPQIRPFRRPETGVEFYFTASCVGKVVWTLVRQLRGPHLSMWA